MTRRVGPNVPNIERKYCCPSPHEHLKDNENICEENTKLPQMYVQRAIVSNVYRGSL